MRLLERSERHFGLRVEQTCPPCTGDCDQGRQCPVREACRLPEDEGLPTPYFSMFIKAILICAGLAALAVMFGAKL